MRLSFFRAKFWFKLKNVFDFKINDSKKWQTVTQNRGTDGSLVSRPSEDLSSNPGGEEKKSYFFPKAYLLLLYIVVTIQAIRLLPRHFLLFPVFHVTTSFVCNIIGATESTILISWFSNSFQLSCTKSDSNSQLTEDRHRHSRGPVPHSSVT